MIQEDGANPHRSRNNERVQFCPYPPRKEDSDEYRDLVAVYSWLMLIARYIVYLTGLSVLCIAWKEMFGFSWLMWPTGLYAIAVAYIEIARFLKRKNWKKGTVADARALEGRLCCIGDADDLSQYGTLTDVPFEPRVFKASLTMSRTSVMTVVTWALLGVNTLFSVDLATTFGEVAFVLVVGSGFLLSCLLLFRPKYFRLVPGKLEILTFSFFKFSRQKREEIDLRDVKIIADLHINLVVIKIGKRVIEYTIQFLPERKRFVHSLFLAAISTSEPTPLPADALLG